MYVLLINLGLLELKYCKRQQTSKMKRQRMIYIAVSLFLADTIIRTESKCKMSSIAIDVSLIFNIHGILRGIQQHSRSLCWD